MENSGNDSQQTGAIDKAGVFIDKWKADAPGELEKAKVEMKQWIKGIPRPWYITICIVAATVLVMAYGSLREEAEPVITEKKMTNVEVMTIQTEEFIESLTLPAIINADRVATVKAEFSGNLEKWFFPEGGPVEMGDVIAEIDTQALRLNKKELEAALETASQNVNLGHIKKESALVSLTNSQKNLKIQEISLESAESNHKLAKKQFNRVKRLAKKKVNTLSQLDDAQNALTQAELSVFRAKQNLNSASLGIRSAELAIKEATAGITLANSKIAELKASIDLLEYRIGKGKLIAPFSGRLEEYLVQPGELVSSGTPVAIIYDLKILRVSVNVPDRYVAFLDPTNEGAKEFIRKNMQGAELRIRPKLIIPGLPKLTGGAEAGVELDAEIARIAQASDPESNTFTVELKLPNPFGALKHGLIVRSRIEYLYYPNAVTIPVKSIQVTDIGPQVLVVEESDGSKIVKSKNIEPISIHGSNVLVQAGLVQGDRLIVAGWKGLVGGEKVNILVDDGKFIKPEFDNEPESDEK